MPNHTDAWLSTRTTRRSSGLYTGYRFAYRGAHSRTQLPPTPKGLALALAMAVARLVAVRKPAQWAT